MNSVQYSSEPSWSRRCSIESILSIQGKETDIVCDTSDTEPFSQDEEYEPVSDVEEEQPPVSGSSSGESDNEIIATKVIEVSVGDDGDLQFADSEQTEHEETDSEFDLADYWRCAQCNAANNNPIYRYCEKCYKVRKNFFPPRPKRKQKRTETSVPRTLSQDSGVESQELSQADQPGPSQNTILCPSKTTSDLSPSSSNLNEPSQSINKFNNRLLTGQHLKRLAESADRNNKRIKVDYSESETECESGSVSPLSKTISDPSLTIEDTKKITKRVISDVLQEKLERDKLDKDKSNSDKVEKDDNMCIICYSEPKSGVFVHGRIAHICCCYRCAVKVWSKAKRCPVCNCRVSNVLKAVVM